MSSDAATKDFPIVGIGASAGGLEALQSFFKRVSNDSGMAFIVVQHLSPDFKSMMKELLESHTKMPIHIASDEMEVKPDNIYLIPIKNNIIVKDRVLYLQQKEERTMVNLPIDLCFNSIGQDVEELAVGIILSGTGTDGSRGIRTIKELGGKVLIQSPESAKFDGMPKAAIASGEIDFIGSIAEIVEELEGHIGKGKMSDESLIAKTYKVSEEPEEKNSPAYDSILQLLERVSNIRLRDYKKPTILRRIEKRMNMNNIASLSHYYHFLISNEPETQTLARECMINVSSFFRDPEAWKVMSEKVIPKIFNNRHETVRMWSAGCSTGEEPYTLAMLVEEHLLKNDMDVSFKIFASDVDKEALSKAANGYYSESEMEGVVEPLRERYFDALDNNHYQIKKSVREKIVFAGHNAINDPPFIRLDLITCRNLLIYLKPHIQKKLLLSFQFAMNPNSFLFLGSSENLGDLTKEFDEVHGRSKMYTKKPYNRQRSLASVYLEEGAGVQKRDSFFDKFMQGGTGWTNNQKLFEGLLIEAFAPACLFVDKDMEVLYLSKKVGKYLQFPMQQGTISTNLTSMVDQNLSLVFRNAIRRLSKRDEYDNILIFRDIEISLHGEKVFLEINVRTIASNDDRIVLAEFKEKKGKKEVAKEVVENFSHSNSEKIKELERELRTVKEELQATIEELETSNEELQASNEELVSSNEELQSTNEELQSVNEELYTVNTEMQAKQQELIDSNNDINNLLMSTEIGTIFLDENAAIRKITPQAKVLFNLMEEDIGRPINHFTNNFNYQDILKDVEEVMRSGQAIEKQVQHSGKERFLLRVTPFKTERYEVKGTIISFIDISQLTQTLDELHYTERQLQSIFHHSLQFICLVDLNGRIELINKTINELELDEVKGKKIWEFYEDSVREKIKGNFQEMLERKEVVDQEQEFISNEGVRYLFKEQIIPVIEDGEVVQAILISEEVTKEKVKQEELEKSEQNYRELLNKLPYIVSKFDENYCFVYANEELANAFNTTVDKLIGKTPKALGLTDEAVTLHREYYEKAWKSKKTVHYLSKVDTPQGEHEFETYYIPMLDVSEGVSSVLTLSRDKSLHDDDFKDA